MPVEPDPEPAVDGRGRILLTLFPHESQKNAVTLGGLSGRRGFFRSRADMGAEESKASSAVEYDANHPTSPGDEGPVHLALAPQEGRPPRDSVAWIPAPVALPEPGIAAPPATKSAAPATKKVAGSTKPAPAGVFGDAKDYNPVLPNTTSKDDKSMQHHYVTKDIKITKRPKMDFRIAIYDSGLIANVGPDGLASEAGIEVGDTLLAVDGVEIKSAKDFYDILRKVRDSTTFKVKKIPQVKRAKRMG